MAFVTLEDLSGSAELILFPDTYKSYGVVCTPDTIALVRGKISAKDGERKLVVQTIVPVREPAEVTQALASMSNTTPLRSPAHYKHKSHTRTKASITGSSYYHHPTTCHT
jgi:DNA polymerase III alpha subunit